MKYHVRFKRSAGSDVETAMIEARTRDLAAKSIDYGFPGAEVLDVALRESVIGYCGRCGGRIWDTDHQTVAPRQKGRRVEKAAGDDPLNGNRTRVQEMRCNDCP